MSKIDLAYWAQTTARRLGAADSSIVISNQRQINVEYRDGKTDKVKESTQYSLSIEIYAGGKYSSHSTNDLRKPALEKFINNCITMTRYLGEDPFQDLPDPQLYEGRSTRDLQLSDASYQDLSTERRLEMARAIYEAIQGRDKRLVSATAYYDDSSYENIHIKSNGFEGTYRSTSFGLGAEVSLDDGSGKKPQSWKYYRARHLEDLPAREQIAAEALQRTRDSVGRQKITSAALPMILENSNVGGLLWRLWSALSGASVQQKESFLEGRLGSRVATEKLTLSDDPLIVRGLGSRYYDGDGIAARELPVIAAGILQNYYVDVYYGRKLSMAPTTGSASNITFLTGKRPAAEIERDLDRGILVTEFIGGNANNTTGDFSLGIAGWLIENGHRTKPVGEMNISGNFLDILKQIVEIGNDPYPYSSMRSPTLVFEGIQFAGK